MAEPDRARMSAMGNEGESPYRFQIDTYFDSVGAFRRTEYPCARARWVGYPPATPTHRNGVVGFA
jgi:hypothetical protein